MSCQGALWSAAVMETKLALCIVMLQAITEQCSRRCSNVTQARVEGEKHFQFCTGRFPSNPTVITVCLARAGPGRKDALSSWTGLTVLLPVASKTKNPMVLGTSSNSFMSTAICMSIHHSFPSSSWEWVKMIIQSLDNNYTDSHKPRILIVLKSYTYLCFFLFLIPWG